MNKAIRWMAHNHVAANLLMLVFIVGGLVIGSHVKQEVFPEIDLDMIQVSVAYPGAGPEEVEEGILLKIEENVSGVNGIKQIKSTAAEGFGVVNVEVLPDEDTDQVLQDVKAEVDRIFTFPEEAEKPVITKLTRRREVVSLVVYGDAPERSLREQAEAIRDELLALPEITQVELGGVRPYEISIEVSEENLRRYQLTLDQVAQRVRRASLDLPGGVIKAAGGEILLRTKERRYWGEEYNDITIVQNPDGTEVKLGDIATVRDTFRETDEFASFDGKPAAMVSVFRVGDQKPTVISDVVQDYIAQKSRSLPPTIKLASWNDTSELFKSRMNLLVRNAFLGLILVLGILGLFLQIRLALWVMLGIPISFLGALLLMPVANVSINMISLFAFILALGIVVDDAIVVGENIYEHRQQGKSYWRAAVDGAIEVAGPVIFSVLTTVAAFLPLLFVSGNMGKFIKVIPAVVITILLVSLVESLFVLPAHLSLGGPEKSKDKPSAAERLRLGFNNRLQRFINGPYQRLLALCLRHRYSTVAAAIAILLLSAGLVGGGIVKFRFMPEVEGDEITATLQMPFGTPVEKTEQVVARIVDEAEAVVQEYDQTLPAGGTVLRHIYAVVGSKVIAREGDSSSGAHLAEVALLLTPSENREVSAAEISRRWRARVGEVPGADSLEFASDLMHFGANIDIQLAHNDFTVLGRAADRVKQALATYPGVDDIADNYAQGKRELKLRLTSEARTLGITEEDLGRQIRAAFYGAEALRLQRGRNEVKVMVRYPERDRKSLSGLESMRIRTPAGGEIPFSRAAAVEQGRGFSTINRTDRKRVINVTASVDKTTNPGEVLKDMRQTVLTGLRRDFPGLTFDLEGEQKEQRQSFGSMKSGFGLALFMIFVLLAIPFRSYSQPFIIMLAIPFGIVGAILGHFIMGYNLSILSVFGIVALSGVVVNDSLLLIDYVNRSRQIAGDSFQAVVEGGVRRFRPILLTSLTTFFGLAPMIVETSVQAQFLIPMAISLGFGILFATGITLLLIPALYLVLEDIRGLFGLGSLQRDWPEQEGKRLEEACSKETGIPWN